MTKKVTLQEITQWVKQRKEFKIKVNPETSEQVQEAVFAGGGEWVINSTTVQFIEKEYLAYSRKPTDYGMYLYWADKLDYNSYLRNTQEFELVEIPDFKTQAEIWEYLLSGGAVVHENPLDSYYKIADGAVRYFNINNNTLACEGTAIQDFSDYGLFRKFTPKVKKEWWENIPEKGILCWVWNDPTYRCVDVIISLCTKGPKQEYNGKNGLIWKNAEPMTQQDFEEYMYKGQNEKS